MTLHHPTIAPSRSPRRVALPGMVASVRGGVVTMAGAAGAAVPTFGAGSGAQ